MRNAASLIFLALAVSCLAETKVDSKQKRYLGHSQTYGPPISSSNVGVATSSVHALGPAANVLQTAAPAAVVTKTAPSAPFYTNLASAPVVTNLASSGFSSGHQSLKFSSETPFNAASAGSHSNAVSSEDPISSEFDANAISSGSSTGLGLEYASGFQYGAPALPALATTSQITIEQPVPVPVYHPVRITVPRPAPYPVLQPYPVEVPRPVHVSVPHPIPFNVPRPYPVTVNKPYPIQIPQLVPVPVAQPVAVEVPKPYPVHVSYPVPVKQPYPVVIPVAKPVPDVAPLAPAAEVAKSAAGYTASTSGVAHSGDPWSTSAGLGNYASLFSSLNLGGSSYSAPSTGSHSLDITPSVEISAFTESVIGGSSIGFSSDKYLGNSQGAPLKAPTGGPSGEKWTGLLTNEYKGAAAPFQGFVGNLQGAFRPSKLVGSSLSTAGRFSSAGGATFRSNSFKAEDGDDYYPYP